MVHGRMIRPAVAGAVPVKVDESSIKDIPGAKVVWDKGFLGVVADKEWDAIQAAEKLKVEWSDAAPPFPEQASLYDHIRKAPVRKREVEAQNGNVDEAFKTAAQRHRGRIRMAVPVACQHGAGLRAGRDQGRQGHLLERHAEIAFRAATASPPCCELPVEKVHVIWTAGPGLLRPQRRRRLPPWTPPCWRKAVGRPVRLQYMRDQGTGWDPKGPASIHSARAALDAAGNVVAYEFTQQGVLARRRRHQRRQAVRHAGRARRSACALKSGDGFGVPAESYAFANKRAAWETIPPLLDRASPLRTLASARSGRAANPLRQRILHRRGGGGAERRSDRVPPALHQGSARHRRHQGGGGEGRAGRRGRRRAATRPATRCPAAASPMRSATARASR